MRPYLECVACAARQAVEAIRTLNLSDEVGIRVLSRVLERLQKLDWRVPPPIMGRDIHRLLREAMGHPDPYRELKLRATLRALELLPEAEARIAAAADPFHDAACLSIAGNAIDLGAPIGASILVEDVLREASEVTLDANSVEELRRSVLGAGSVLFLADNAGELVLDRPLLERIGPDRVTVVVRGGPTLNDATLEDAERSGITERFRVITSGVDVPGTWLPDCSSELVAQFERTDVVIAKGQGNYETLSDCSREVFFMLRVKCSSVGRDLDASVGAFVIRRWPGTNAPQVETAVLRSPDPGIARHSGPS